MPGICGHIGELAQTRSLPLMGSLAVEEWYHTAQWTDASVFLGLSSHGFSGQRVEAIHDGDWIAVFDGTIFEIEGCRDEDLYLAFLRGYANYGKSFIRRVDGSFGVAMWNPRTETLVLANDRFGSRIVHWSFAHGGFEFSTRIRALADSSARISKLGVAQFFSFGQYFGQHTLYEDIEVLPAAAHYVFSQQTGNLEREVYWRSSEAKDAPENDRELLEAADIAFSKAVARQTQTSNRYGIALSGGLDARSVLAVLDCERLSPTAICYTVPSSLDHRASKAMAEISKCKYQHFVLGKDFIARFPEHLQRLVEITDAQYLSQGIVTPTLPIYRELGLEVLLRGHAGELMHMQKAYAFSVDEEALAIRSNEELRSWLRSRLPAYMIGGLSQPLFKEEYQDAVQSGVAETIEYLMSEYEGVDDPLQRIWHIFLGERIRRETTLSLAKFGTVVEPRVPYLDNELINLLLAAPTRMKLGDTIQDYILRKRRPEFRNIVNANTGAKLGAGRLTTKFCSLRNRVLAKLGMPGFQPYERLGLWLRRELLDFVRDTLLADSCIERGVFRPETVRSVIDEHVNRQSNHTFLIMALLIFELGQRNRVNRFEQSYAEA